MYTTINNNAVIALLEEYDKSIQELKTVISPISDDVLKQIVDSTTKDKDCRSIQTILSHVVESGYNYIVEIRKWLGETKIERQPFVLLNNVKAYQKALDDMFLYNVRLFQEQPDISIEHHQAKDKIQVRWGQLYDVEQLIEHAIVHILRHRRQIEYFIKKIDFQRPSN